MKARDCPWLFSCAKLFPIYQAVVHPLAGRKQQILNCISLCYFVRRGLCGSGILFEILLPHRI
jgi:hypothetical protein